MADPRFPELDPTRPTGWFEPLYARASAGEGVVPWDGQRPSPHLAARVGDGTGASAVVVGCGLGDDAALLAERGWTTTAFDVAPTALRMARERFPDAAIELVEADLLDLPGAWHRAFDLVVEHYTVQALPPSVRERATAAVGSLVAPGGRLLVEVIATQDASPERPGPPWALTRAELDAFAGDGLETVRVDEIEGGAGWFAELRRPAARG